MTIPFRYAQSHQNDPLGCAVGLAVIQVIDDLELKDRSAKIGKYFIDKLHIMQSKYMNNIKEIRARGLMIALEFESCVCAENVYLQLIENGILVGHKENTLRFMPPLIIETFQIDKLINAIDQILNGI